MTSDVVSEAVGQGHREDPVLAGMGGPAGNARLTAWTGVVLLVLFIAELTTLLDVRGLVSWHVVIGVLLVPPALLKTASTGWRILRYYTGNRPFRDAGPPPLLLRVLGPVVVISTLAVLISGLALIAVGPDTSRQVLVRVLGQPVDTLAIHKVTFVVWAVATGLHTVGRIVPALRLTVIPGLTVVPRLTVASQTAPRPVPGRYWRVGGLAVTLIAAAITATVVLGASGAWLSQPSHRPQPPGRHATR